MSNYQGKDGEIHCVLRESDKTYACGLERDDLGSHNWLHPYRGFIGSNLPTTEAITCLGCLRALEKE